MGQCISAVPAKAAPKCRVCGFEGPLPWNKMDATQHAAWAWRGDEAMCRKCMIVEQLDQIQYEKNRKWYKRAKEEMYPKISEAGKPQLKRLISGEKWDNSSSFKSSWRPPSTLERLLSAIRRAQAVDPKKYVGMQRKGTGFVPASAPPALPSDGEPSSALATAPHHGVGVEHTDATEVEDLTATKVERQREEENVAASHRQLVALEEEHGVEVVEEVSLCGNEPVGSGMGTFHEDVGEGDGGDGGGAGSGGGDAAAPVAQQQPQQRGQLLQSSAASRRMAA